MEYTNLNIRTSKETKAAAEKIFDELGINTSTAFNIFLKAVIRENGLPFDMRVESPNAETIAAIEEGRKIAHDPNVKGYTSIEELRAALGL
ncbi:type II toxin-antitoxin system RelB/DinJ family antitoxin [Anaerocaecibacter muris]|uniref:type II toxin-antitoxin system RelB/DinJ family antitoxin n=1 Tax=Anaerocaecibacter muris TaxID=2941513 RepID=UPI00203EF5A2|nr:type II toxin-antitoxin system RelB/DinJ family antitoxin [Anaerocaecibacter muris]